MSRANTKQPSRVLVRSRCDVFPLTNGDRNGRLNRSFDPLSHKNTIQHTPLIFRRSSTSILPNKGLWQYALWLEMDSEYDKHYLWHYWEVVKGYRSIDAIISRDLKVCYVMYMMMHCTSGGPRSHTHHNFPFRNWLAMCNQFKYRKANSLLFVEKNKS